MKLSIQSDQWRVTSGELKNSAPTAPHASRLTPHARQGVALVITLIMLSVTLIMAVAFLAVARRERNAVSTTTDTATARLAADSARAAAQAQIVANVLASTNAGAYDFHLLVSTNYINYLGYNAAAGANPTNVNYDYYVNGTPGLSVDDRNQNIANLLFLPRAPVVVGSNDFRFYLDLNRNGRFETNGVIAEFDNAGLTNGAFGFHTGDPEWIGVLERPDQPHGPNNQFIARYAFLAQPIGNSLDLNYLHNQTLNPDPSLGVQDGYFRNQGVGSWELNLAAFLADLNTNQWGQVIGAPSLYYQYNRPGSGFANSGYAFEDARALLAWRYNFNYNNLATANNSLTNLFNYPYNADIYSDGPLQTTVNTNINLTPDNTSLHWAGGDNTNNNANRFFELPSEIFNPPNSFGTLNNFINRLGSAGAGKSTYDRYTFYRMMDQLGTDSSPERGKLNLNYSNAVVEYNADGVVTNIAIVVGAETNLVRWRAQDFFNAAADKMLRFYTTNWFASNPTNFLETYYNYPPPNYIDSNGYGLTNFPYVGMVNQVPSFGVGNIPVYVYGRFVYSPAINRILQLAANLYDASTNKTAALGMDYPSVFRPILLVTNQFGYRNVYISGYEHVEGVNGYWAGLNFVGTSPLTRATNVTDLVEGLYNNQNAYGVPWIIGAKKGMPSFNQLYANNVMQVTRKLEITRPFYTLDSSKFTTNQMYVISITNNVGISFWNSFSNNYPRPLTVVASDVIQTSLTNGVFPNGFQFQPGSSFVSSTNYIYIANINSWPGSQWGKGGNIPPTQPNKSPIINSGSFFYTNWSFNSLPESIYRLSSGYLVPSSSNQLWEINQPLWGLDHQGSLGFTTTNLLQAYILDGNYIIDYVQLRGPIDNANINQVLADPNYPNPFDSAKNYLWSTNAYQPPAAWPPYGVMHQIFISLGNEVAPPNAKWKNPPADKEIASFQGFFQPHYYYGGVNYTNTELSVQVPYTPTRAIFDYVLWQANDPLVHYLGTDLAYVDPGAIGWQNDGIAILPTMSPSSPGSRFQPWGLNKQMGGLANVDGNAYNQAFKDSLVWCPENWNFPTNLYPSVGLIGRVHRGTPWQTIYLKATNVLSDVAGGLTWPSWTGDKELTRGQYFDAINSAPSQDRFLFDLFTAAPNENATRGQLSVNVAANPNDMSSGLAAWSALFGGMVSLQNSLPFSTVPKPSYTAQIPTVWSVVSPAGVDLQSSALWQIVTNINSTRTNVALFPQGTFTHVGDILRVPMLSDKSPLLNFTNAAFQQKYGISDEVYEWLPQQMMSLLNCPTGPRYVVYCYGQTLRPAPDGAVLSGNLFGMVTNYQVTAESAARAVIRLERHVTATGTNYSTVVESYNVLGPD